MKSNLHRKMQGKGTGYMANNPNLYPSWKGRYKATSNRNMRRVLDRELQALVITDHMTFQHKTAYCEIPSHIRMAHGDFNFDPTLDDKLAEWQEEEHQQWIEQCYDCTDDSGYSYHTDSGFGGHGPDPYWDHESVAIQLGDVMLRTYTPDLWKAYAGYDNIGSIWLDRDNMVWNVDFAPMRGPQIPYTFDYLESSPEHGLQLLAMLHRMGASHEGFEDVPH